jgi:hypothetical protein
MKHSPLAIEDTHDHLPHRRTIKGEHRHPCSTPPLPFSLPSLRFCALSTVPLEQHRRRAHVPVASRSPPPHHHDLPTVRTPKAYSSFPLHDSELPCPRAATRLSFGELPAAPRPRFIMDQRPLQSVENGPSPCQLSTQK